MLTSDVKDELFFSKRLIDFWLGGPVSYDPIRKKQFKKISKNWLQSLALALGAGTDAVIDWHIRYNEGGVAVSGDHTLMMLFTKEVGAYVLVSMFGERPSVMFRSIKHMRDFQGGDNQWLEERVLRTFTMDELARVVRKQVGAKYET